MNVCLVCLINISLTVCRCQIQWTLHLHFPCSHTSFVFFLPSWLTLRSACNVLREFERSLNDPTFNSKLTVSAYISYCSITVNHALSNHWFAEEQFLNVNPDSMKYFLPLTLITQSIFLFLARRTSSELPNVHTFFFLVLSGVQNN